MYDTSELFRRLRDQLAAEPDLAEFNIESLAVPSLRLVTQPVPYARLELGESRIGGVPDTPPGFEWPRWTPPPKQADKFGTPGPDAPIPLGFIAQIDLAAVPQIDVALPTSGWLYFFYDRYCEPWGYDPADRGCCRLLYVDSDRSTLVRADKPADLEPEHIAELCALEISPELTIPDDQKELKYGMPSYEAYVRIRDGLIGSWGSKHHRLLGHPQVIQNPMELECQLASNGVYCGDATGYRSAQAKALEPGAADWRLLLQIDTDEDGPGWCWGDAGRIYFWIKQQDLEARRFDDVWLVFQCG